MRQITILTLFAGLLGSSFACNLINGDSDASGSGSTKTDQSSLGGSDSTPTGTRGGSSSVNGTKSKTAGGSTSSSTRKSNAGGATTKGGSSSTSTDDPSGTGGVEDVTDTGGTSSSETPKGGTGGKTPASTRAQGGKAGTEGTASTSRGGAAGGTRSNTTDSSSTPSDELRKSQCGGKPGPSYEQFFDNGTLATLKVTLDAASLGGKSADQWLDALWAKWDHCPPHDNYISSKFEYSSPDNTVSCENVGIRLRGSWTRTEQAAFVQTRGFKLDMTTLDTSSSTHRRFADLNRINILSIESDPTHMYQCLSYKMMRDFGIPAPRCNYLKVYVNNKYYGLLPNVEQVNKGYARRHFGTNSSSLYGGSPGDGDCPKGIQDSAAKLNYSGDSFSSYTSQYQLTNATSAGAEKDLIPMLKCGDATQTPDDAKFKTCVSEWIDVEEWLHLIAAESVMPELESFVGYYRNWYLHFTPDSAAPHGGRFVIWPWDLDTSFNKISCYPTSCDPFTSVDSFYGPRNARAKFVTRLTTVFKSEYCTALKDFVSKVFKTTAVDEFAKVMEPGISGDPSVTPTTWQSEVSKLRTHITSRASSVQSQISSTCQ